MTFQVFLGKITRILQNITITYLPHISKLEQWRDKTNYKDQGSLAKGL
jgi:hypothetical protein